LTNLDLQFLVTSKGSLSQPQRIIVGARINYQKGTFRYVCRSNRCQGGAGGGAIVSEKIPFEIRSTVSFVTTSTGNNLVSFVPDAPGIIASLPNDIFYPFVMSS
jgi:hypothetical protein